MSLYVLLGLSLLLSVLFGYLAVKWVKVVNAESLLGAITVSVILDTAHTLDTVLIVSNVWTAVTSVIGAALGTYIGLTHRSRVLPQ